MSSPSPDDELVCCPFCLSIEPHLVGVEKATGITCRHSFHCPVPEYHGNPFLVCPHCWWTATGETERRMTEYRDQGQ